MKLFRLTRLKMTVSAAALALATGAAVLFLTPAPAYACTPGSGKLEPLLNLIGRLFGL